ncbi:MAG TPA: translesion DNA synthesis-associated protein ImuA [Arenimonas sp.]|jgi:hypothetical protein|nr:translesion DNA synthesis-associated protein ImuA [Arenimonas sp.]
MGAVLSLHDLMAERRLWRGRPAEPAGPGREPTGHAALDAVLPGGGWPEGALTEVLIPADGIGELELLLPSLARISRAGRPVVWVQPPYLPYAPALARAGLDLRRIWVVEAGADQAAWALEQCLRSGACGAVLGWPAGLGDRQLRRLQVAAETGQCLGFLFRPLSAARNPSPAALRLQFEGEGLRVLKCRGAQPPATPLPWPARPLH